MGLSACKKFLDTKPTDFITPDYNTVPKLEAALAGVYDVLGNTQAYGENYPFNLNVSTDIEYTNAITANTPVYVYGPSDNPITVFWMTMFTGIYRANQLLAKVDNEEAGDSAARNRIKGQALFLRGYYTFMLVSNYGDIPLSLDPNPPIADIKTPRMPQKQVYAQVLKDMEQAELLVDEVSDGAATGVNFGGRVSKSAVQGILARVNLKMAGFPLFETARYAEALKWAAKVKDSGKHRLNPDYRNIFINYAQDKYDVKESIWEVEFFGNNVGAYREYCYYIGRRGGIRSDDPIIGASGGLIFGTRKLFNLYGENPQSTSVPKASFDIRRDWNIAPYFYTGNPGIMTANADLWRRFMGKWRREYELVTPKAVEVSPQNFPLLRYADVLLMLAEAENELNGPDKAYPYVNEVRKRAYGILYGNVVKHIAVTTGGAGYTSAPSVVITGGGGSGATATAIVSAGVVTGIVLTNPGTLSLTGPYYSTPPTVTITGGGGTGAAAVASLTDIADADLNMSQISSKESLRLAIKEERARELCFEATRRSDLIRWGNFVGDMKTYLSWALANGASVGIVTGAQNVSNRNNLLPIPLYDMSLNKALTQNPGY